jgi:hypothetical protein
MTTKKLKEKENILIWDTISDFCSVSLPKIIRETKSQVLSKQAMLSGANVVVLSEFHMAAMLVLLMAYYRRV